ncbi:hypothetical protein OAI56_00715 [Amylibacter sp.]|nr:hypothetical protein [Amylibacter sp.]
MLLNCAECNNKISSKAKECPQCGAPAPDWVDRISDTGLSILGVLFIGIVLFGMTWNFFLKSTIEISDFKIHYGIISDRKISFTAKNSGPKNTYNYHVKIGDKFWDRLFSSIYCDGIFVMERDEERHIKIECPDLNFTSTEYSIVVK